MGWRFGQRRDDRVPPEVHASAGQAGPADGRAPESEQAGQGPAALLRPDRGIVEFTGRTGELAELRAWCASDSAHSVRVLAGAGGVGKTRLALEIAAGWQEGEGQLRLVAAGQEAQAVENVRRAYPGRVLLVVDDARTRAGLDELLRAVPDDPGPIRVLLVARSLGEWWERLIAQSAPAVARLLTEAAPVLLDAPVRRDVSDAELAEAAVPYFARALSVRMPGRVEVERAARRVPVLMLHAAALVGLLRLAAVPSAALRVVVSEGVLHELLEHEARYWRRAAVAAGLPDDGPLVQQVVAAAALVGAGSVAEAAAVVERVPDLAGRPAEERQRWARWLYALCPAGADGRLGLPQPDLLAETLAAAQLAADPDLARSCLRDLTAEQAEHALTVLARASAHQGGARQVIVTALRGDLARLGIAAARVALQTEGDLGDLLAQAIEDAAAPPQVLADLALALPYPSGVLARAHLAATLRALESLPADTEPETRAQWDDRAGLLLSRLDRRADALLTAQEAVTIRRELAAGNSRRHRADLAASLTNLGVRFSELGRPADALRAEQEAVTIYRELATSNLAGYRPDLARSLTVLGVRYFEVGRPGDALGAEHEAVDIYRELAMASTGQYRPDLAASLGNLGVWYSESGQPADAVAPTSEAVTIYRELAATSPGRYLRDLAACLTNLGIWYSELGRPADALSAEQEALVIRRELAADNPEEYRPDLARSLSNLGVWFSELGRPADALRAEHESVAIRRQLTAASPDRYLPDLAAALTNLGITYAEFGHPADALPAVKEAVTIYRELAAADPERYRPDLARSLTNLGIRYSELGRPGAAAQPIQEAVTIRRKLAAAEPERYVPDLARSLANLGIRLAEAGRPADAVAAEQEAVSAYRQLAAASPDRYRPDLARALSALAAALSALGRESTAAHAEAEATMIRQALKSPRAGSV